MYNNVRLLIISVIAGALLAANCSKNDLAGSGTETGNVTGTVITSKSAKVSGAKVSLFEKKAEINSPEEVSKPVDEVYSDDTGHFSFKVDAGNYTIVASLDSEYAFRDSVSPGTANAKDMEVILQKPGAIKGEILNTIELRGTGSVVVHLTGTSIYKNVGTDGTFTLDNVPAGKYTMVSYSTYQPEFSPNYKQVTVYSDSVTDLGKFSLTYNGIPIPKNIKVVYDTAHEVVRISWDSISTYKDFQEYAILRGQAGLSEHNLKQIGYTSDTVFYDSIKFSSEQPSKYEYSVLVHNKLGDAGKYYGIYSVDVMPYGYVIPKIDTLKTSFDTTKGIVNISWDSVANNNGFGGYILMRTIIRKSISKSDTIIDTVAKTTEQSFPDTLFPKKFKYSDSSNLSITYSICAYQKEWKLYGLITSAKTFTINPYYTLVPIVDSIGITYDTLGGTLKVSWDTLKNSSALEGYEISCKISNVNAGVNKTENIFVKNTSFIDTIYPKYVDFNTLTETTVSYTISAKNKIWGITGVSQSQSIKINSYKKFKPVVNAGSDQNVDISSDVLLKGSVISSRWPIVKTEWKIGDGNWITADSGTATFKTSSTLNNETILCVFKATDSTGNVGVDTMSVVKQQLVVTFTTLPGMYQATSTVITNKAWMVGVIDYTKYAVWSTSDYVTWKTENVSPGIQNEGGLVYCNDKYYYYNFCQNSYMSNDCITWEYIKPNMPKDPSSWCWSNVCSLNSIMYCMLKQYGKNDTLCYSSDGVNWSRVGTNITAQPQQLVAYSQKLYGIFGGNVKMVSNDNGGTWTDAPLWDTDYSIFPDDVYQLFGNDSILVAYYNERPGAGNKRLSMLRNGTWTNIPMTSVENSGNKSSDFFLFKNRLMWIVCNTYPNFIPKSIKLY